MSDRHRPETAGASEAARSRIADRVLLAVDDAAFADLYRETLGSVGWHVDVVNDWRSAWVRLLGSQPDVLVLDSLPELKQTDALDLIRSHAKTRGLPVILLTDALEPGDQESARELGVLDLLVKSRATRQTLSETLRRLLNNRTESPRNGGDTGRPPPWTRPEPRDSQRDRETIAGDDRP